MNHPAELAVHSFLQKVMLGKANVDGAILDLVAKDVEIHYTASSQGVKENLS